MFKTKKSFSAAKCSGENFAEIFISALKHNIRPAVLSQIKILEFFAQGAFGKIKKKELSRILSLLSLNCEILNKTTNSIAEFE